MTLSWILSAIILHATVHKSASVRVSNSSDLCETWRLVYGLNNVFPPLTIPSLPDPAPHLQECHRLHKKRVESEQYDAEGNLPIWARGGPGSEAMNPPWILGGDQDNLPNTRIAQRELWKHQFPRNCSDPSIKFLLVTWSEMRGHGLGSTLHIFAQRLAMALKQKRIIVAERESFIRSINNECASTGYSGSLDCYFFPLTSPACEERAHLLYKEKRNKRNNSEENIVNRAYGRGTGRGASVNLEGMVDPWLPSMVTVEVFGEVMTVLRGGVSANYSRPIATRIGARDFHSSWWYAQAIRFILRWPTPYMCHIANKIRHVAYGQETANGIVEANIRQEIAKEMANKAGDEITDRIDSGYEPSSSEPISTLERALWWQDKPYMPRPIVSMHIRKGDKITEMKLFSMASYMWHANRLKKHSPSLRHIWLSTEMEDVIEEAAEYKSWTFHYSRNRRQRGALPMENYTIDSGVQHITEISFANLLISSECDAFVGALGSNWNRLINELRSTGGKLKAGIASVNFGEN